MVGRHALLRWLGLLCIAWCLVVAPMRWELDSITVSQGALELKRWLSDSSHGSLGDIGAFAPFQYLTAVPVYLMTPWGFPISPLELWSACSRAGLLGMMGLLLWEGCRRGVPGGGWLMGGVLLAGPLTAYATSTFNEVTAACLILLLIAIGLRGPPWAAALLFIVAGLTKETAFPLLSLLWAWFVWQRRRDAVASVDATTSVGRWSAWWLIALLITAAMLGSFNRVRYGSVWNQHYLQPQLLVRPWAWRAEYAAALWLSPNGGVAAFWPAWVVVVGMVLWRGRRRRQAAVAIAAIVGLLLVLTYGLACWHMPFGWWCWGPRLMLPWLPAILYLLLATFPAEVGALAHALTSNRRRQAVITALLIMLALPHASMLVDQDSVQRFFWDDGRFAQPQVVDDVESQHRYTAYQAWCKRPWMLVLPLRNMAAQYNALYITIFSAGVALCVRQMIHPTESRGPIATLGGD